ncbi:6635_t:CDS:2 [Entrophospora sp. SA101]|nr:6635_t:CDS:2 [Entrophospora sp. SA101]CAJ0825155.1 13417_t:CDS:2 [Entrophospora sp. SA101]
MPKRSARIQNKTSQTTPPAHTGNNKVTKPTKGKVIMVEKPIQQTSKVILDKGKENQFEIQDSGLSTKTTDNTSPPLLNFQPEAAPHTLKDKDESSSPDISMEDLTDQEQAPLIVHITRQTEHMAGVPFDKIKGKTAKEKTKNLDKLFASFVSYSGTHVRVNKKVKYLVVNFINEEDLQKAIQQEIKVSDTEKIYCIKWDEIKPPTPEEEKHKEIRKLNQTTEA